MNESVAWRSPAFGVVPPKSTVTVTVQIPFDVNREAPLVLTASGRGVLLLKEVFSNKITLENPTDRNIPYLLVIASKTALALPDMKWKDRFKLLLNKIFPQT